MRMRPIHLLLLVAAFVACDGDTDVDATRVRVENVSEATYEDVALEFSADTLEFGTLEPGESSAYQTVDPVQPPPLVSLRADAVVYTALPDPASVGIGHGRFTVRIDLDQSGGGIQFEIVEDD